MTVTTFEVSPVDTGDLGADQVKTATATDETQESASLGSIVFKKLTAYYALFLRFDLSSLPKPVKINGVLMQWTADGGGSGTFDVRGGFIDKDGSWDAAGAFSNYATLSELPFAQWLYGNEDDDTVWVGDAPAFEAEMVGSGETHILSFGENLEYDDDTIAVTGLVSQLQTYLNAESAGPSVCLQFYRDYVGATERYQQVVMSDVDAESRPQLRIDWEALGVAEAESELRTLVSAGSALQPIVSAGSALQPMVNAKGVVV